MTALAEIQAKIDNARTRGQILDSAAKNIQALLTGASSDFYLRVVAELIDAGQWSELNDRFYKTLAFGTGGLRGRTIGEIVTKAERGDAKKDPPRFPCVGTNAMNFFNISRATQGLVAYLHDWNKREKVSGRPKLAIAHDTRFFSKEFADLTAKIASDPWICSASSRSLRRKLSAPRATRMSIR